MILRVSSFWIAGILFWHNSALAADNSRTVIFILSGDSPVYERVVTSAEQRIKIHCLSESANCGDLEFKHIKSSRFDSEEIDPASLIVTLGTKAASQAASLPQAGVRINAMLPLRKKTGFASDPGKPFIDIYLDQPYNRYFELINSILPRAARVGLLIHESNSPQIDEIDKAADAMGLTLKIGLVNKNRDIGESLSYLLGDIDALLALPDARIHSSRTISHILTTAYRNGIPVFGFSSAYVKAGATAALYTSPENIAHQIADTIIESFIYGKQTETSQKAHYFSVTFNFEVARSLGLNPISASEIKNAISEGSKQ